MGKSSTYFYQVSFYLERNQYLNVYLISASTVESAMLRIMNSNVTVVSLDGKAQDAKSVRQSYYRLLILELSRRR